jgi:hypothetical protein
MITVLLDLNPMNNAFSAMVGVGKAMASDKFLKEVRHELENGLVVKGFGPAADKAARNGVIPHVYRPMGMDENYNLKSSGAMSDRLWKIAITSRSKERTTWDITFIKNDADAPINPKIVSAVESNADNRFKGGNRLGNYLFPDTASFMETNKSITPSGPPGSSPYRKSARLPRAFIYINSAGSVRFSSSIGSVRRENQYYRKFTQFASMYFNEQFRKGSPIMRSFSPQAQSVARIIQREVSARPSYPVSFARWSAGFFLTEGSKPFKGFREYPRVVTSSEERMMKMMLRQISSAIRSSATRRANV